MAERLPQLWVGVPAEGVQVGAHAAGEQHRVLLQQLQTAEHMFAERSTKARLFCVASLEH